MPTAAELGLSQTDFEAAMNLERMYCLVNKSDCDECGKTPVTHADVNDHCLLCAKCGKNRSAQKISVTNFTTSQIDQFEKKISKSRAQPKRDGSSSRSILRSMLPSRKKSKPKKRKAPPPPSDSYSESSFAESSSSIVQAKPSKKKKRRPAPSRTEAIPYEDSHIGAPSAFQGASHASSGMNAIKEHEQMILLKQQHHHPAQMQLPAPYYGQPTMASTPQPLPAIPANPQPQPYAGHPHFVTPPRAPDGSQHHQMVHPMGKNLRMTNSWSHTSPVMTSGPLPPANTMSMAIRGYPPMLAYGSPPQISSNPFSVPRVPSGSTKYPWRKTNQLPTSNMTATTIPVQGSPPAYPSPSQMQMSPFYPNYSGPVGMPSPHPISMRPPMMMPQPTNYLHNATNLPQPTNYLHNATNLPQPSRGWR